MAQNINKIDSLHSQLPASFRSKTNPNWKGLVEALGESDNETAALIEEVKKQFFIKTSSRPYIDRLANNVNVARPKYIGMGDTKFRKYIPIVSYKPKQVKAIIDAILDIFFFKEATTAYISSINAEPFTLEDGWTLEYTVDQIHRELITFRASDFTDIANATAIEVASVINRQAQHSFAIDYFDNINKNNYIHLFSNTVGSKGSLQIVGGRANIALRFDGFIDGAGNGANTQWAVTKVGEKLTFTYNSGTDPGINQLLDGDVMISALTNNSGSFVIDEVNNGDGSFTLKNLFGTAGTFTQTSVNDVKFFRPSKHVAFTSPGRAITWETANGEISIEMPWAPPVVKTSLKGSTHLNGLITTMTNRDSSSSLTVDNAELLPNSGKFLLQQERELLSHVVTSSEDVVLSTKSRTRIIGNKVLYSYTSRTVASTTGDLVAGSQDITLASVVGVAVGQTVFGEGVRGDSLVEEINGNVITVSVAPTVTANGMTLSFGGNTLTGITPALPALAALHEFALLSVVRTANVVVATTDSNHDYLVGDTVSIRGSSGIPVETTTGDIVEFSNVITNIPNTATGISPGQQINATGIPAGTIVLDVQVGGTITVTMNNQATATSTSEPLDFATVINGPHIITAITDDTFSFVQQGANGTADVPGESSVERDGLSNTGSKLILYTAQSADDTRIKGSYVWDLKAPFILSKNNAIIQDSIQAGRIVRILNINDNTVPEEGGLLIFDYGLTTQEGPVRYLYKPSDNTLALDPAYIFKFNHSSGSSINAIRQKGPIVFRGDGSEYAPYITDQSQATEVLKELILSVKSAGIFVNFLIKFPEQIYAAYSTYEKD